MEDRVNIMVAAFEDELKKIAAALPKRTLGKYLAPAIAGAAGWETLRRANDDRKTGRMVRMQQGGSLF